MLIVPPATLQAAFSQYSTRFNAIFTTTTTWWQRVAMEVPSTGESVTYSILDKIPRMEKWLQGSPRAIANASLRSYTLVNDDWQLAIEVPRNKFNDAQYDQYGGLFASMGAQAKHWPDDMIATLLQTRN